MKKQEGIMFRAGLDLSKLRDTELLREFLEDWPGCQTKPDAISRLKKLPHLLKGKPGDNLEAMLFCLKIAAPPFDPEIIGIQGQAFQIAGEKLIGNNKSLEFLLQDFKDAHENSIERLIDFLIQVIPAWFPGTRSLMKVSEETFKQANVRFAELVRCMYAISISTGRPQFMDQYDPDILFIAYTRLRNCQSELRELVIRRGLFDFFSLYGDKEAAEAIASYLIRHRFMKGRRDVTISKLIRSAGLREKVYREFSRFFVNLLGRAERKFILNAITALSTICLQEKGW